jgi:hypothetical protein
MELVFFGGVATKKIPASLWYNIMKKRNEPGKRSVFEESGA